MSVPQTKDRPASALRAMFAGIGSLLSVWDKVRAKPAAEAPVDAEAPASPVAETPAAAAPETTAEPAPAAEPGTKAEPETIAEPESTVAGAWTATEPETKAEPESTVAGAWTATEPDTAAAAAAAAAEPSVETAAEPTPAADALPLANYDELTVASLRARLRNLSNDDITQLIAYEEGHQNRPEVIKMFRNRIIKMTTGLPKLEA
jgi:hypothetical protein